MIKILISRQLYKKLLKHEFLKLLLNKLLKLSKPKFLYLFFDLQTGFS